MVSNLVLVPRTVEFLTVSGCDSLHLTVLKLSVRTCDPVKDRIWILAERARPPLALKQGNVCRCYISLLQIRQDLTFFIHTLVYSRYKKFLFRLRSTPIKPSASIPPCGRGFCEDFNSLQICFV